MSNAKARNKSSFNSSLKPKKYRPTEAEQGSFTVRLIGEQPTQLTPKQEIEAQPLARLKGLDKSLKESRNSPC